MDLKRFASRYGLFKQGKSEQQVGTPLKLLPWMPEARVEEYTHFKIHTVEQLATASDAIAQNFMGFQTDKQKAQDYLDAANRGVNAQELEDKLSSRDDEIEILKKQMAVMMAGQEEAVVGSDEEA
jgi:predicted RecB family nuclease